MGGENCRNDNIVEMEQVLMTVSSVVDPESDPVRSESFCQIRSRIRNKSFRIWIRAALSRNEFETKPL
jgi:hypothetical protein